MMKIAARYAVVLVPTLAAVWACGGSSAGNGSGDGGGQYGGGGQGSSSGGQGPCGAQSCATGCCDSNGVCQAGNTDTVCGTMNIACEDCTSVDKTCVAGQCGAGGASSGGTMLPGFPGFDAASFPTFEAGTLACTDGSGCSGQLCCFSLATFGSSCQTACAYGSYQLCATGAECPSGQDCAASPYGANSPGYCAAVPTRPDGGGGRPVDSGSGGTSDASSASDDAGMNSTDAATVD
jgi:hypothetical protein